MEPICQFCGAENPMWQLTERSTGTPGPEVCQRCLELLHVHLKSLTSDVAEDVTRPTVAASEVEEWRAVATADTLHMLPIEAAVASQKYLAERLVALADSGAIEVTD